MDDGWEYARVYYDEGGAPHRRIVTKADFLENKPDGHYADGRPYWNHDRAKRRAAGPWLVEAKVSWPTGQEGVEL